MPRKKTTTLLEEITPNEPPTQPENEFIPETQDQQTELSPTVEGLARSHTELIPEQSRSAPTPTALNSQSCTRDFLTQSLASATASIGQLFEKQAELTGEQVADAVFDTFESAFINRLEERLQPFVDVVLPQIKESRAELTDRIKARAERRQTVFGRLQQIATLINDDCKLLPPVVAVGEFVNWEPKQLEGGE